MSRHTIRCALGTLDDVCKDSFHSGVNRSLLAFGWCVYKGSRSSSAATPMWHVQKTELMPLVDLNISLLFVLAFHVVCLFL